MLVNTALEVQHHRTVLQALTSQGKVLQVVKIVFHVHLVLIVVTQETQPCLLLDVKQDTIATLNQRLQLKLFAHLATNVLQELQPKFGARLELTNQAQDNLFVLTAQLVVIVMVHLQQVLKVVKEDSTAHLVPNLPINFLAQLVLLQTPTLR